MRKKILLGILPAFLLLTSCNSSSNTKSRIEEPQFIEKADDEDHFENLEFNNPYRIIDPVEYDPCSVTSLGVQTKLEESGKISIRFIAAIEIDDMNGDDEIDAAELAATTLTWNREMYKADGSVLKAAADFVSDKVYTKVNNGDEVYTIEDYNNQFETDCNYFVTFAIRNIPASYKDAYINVYLNINNSQSTNRILSTTVDTKTSFYFDSDETGLFVVDCTNPDDDGEIFDIATTTDHVQEQNGGYLFYNTLFEAHPEDDPLSPYGYIFVERVVNEKFITYGYSRINQNVGCGALRYKNTEFFYNTREHMGDDDYWFDPENSTYGSSYLAYLDNNKNIFISSENEKSIVLDTGAWMNLNGGNVKFVLDIEVDLKDHTTNNISTTFTLKFPIQDNESVVVFSEYWIPDCRNAVGKFTFKCVDATNYQTVIASVSHEYDISNLQELEYTVDTNNWRMEPVRE